MKNIWTKATTAGTAAALAGLLSVGAAFAAEASNTETGAGSDNDSSVQVENNTTISSTNNANISNNLNISANTGGNSANMNTGDGTVSTGDIDGSVGIETTANSNNFDSLNLSCNSTCNYTSSNTTTGAYSDNDSKVTITNNLDISQLNNADIDNDLWADLNTGNNEADKNTGDGTIMTGDVDFDVEIVTDVNDNNIGGPADDNDDNGGEVVNPPGLPKPGSVLDSVGGLPVTGGSIPTWPALVILAGFALKLLEKIFRVRLLEEAV